MAERSMIRPFRWVRDLVSDLWSVRRIARYRLVLVVAGEVMVDMTLGSAVVISRYCGDRGLVDGMRFSVDTPWRIEIRPPRGYDRPTPAREDDPVAPDSSATRPSDGRPE